MIQISLQVNFNHLPEIVAQLRPQVSTVVRKTAADVESEVKKEMAAPKSGRRYRRGGGMHQASAPGEAPAVDLGQLINSIQTRDESDLTSVVGTNVEYATALEYGTRKMAPRPVWRLVAERLRKPFVDAITQILQRLK